MSEPENILASQLNILEETYPHVSTALNFCNPFELLVATVLAAQTTDKQVNIVTSKLFERYPNATILASASVKDVVELISSVGLYHQKAKNLVALAKQIVEKFDGVPPQTLEELISLPGVGRKTASVVLWEAHGLAALPVDTHTLRVAYRLGWTKNVAPVKVESDLKTLLPEDLWGVTHQRLVYHGRAVCVARKPRCFTCPLIKVCPSSTL